MGVSHDLIDLRNHRIFILGKYAPSSLPCGPMGWSEFQGWFCEESCYPDEWPEEEIRRVWAFCVVARWEVAMALDGQAETNGGAIELATCRDTATMMELTWPPNRAGEKFNIVMSVYGGDALQPDPLKDEQKEAELPEGKPRSGTELIIAYLKTRAAEQREAANEARQSKNREAAKHLQAIDQFVGRLTNEIAYGMHLECGECGAKVGHRCRTETGKSRPISHDSRRKE